jgi:inosine/xanthosine triphosphate pyrophosphatase family protein
MALDDKSAVSHRARAFRDLARWLTAAGHFDGIAGQSL